MKPVSSSATQGVGVPAPPQHQRSCYNIDDRPPSLHALTSCTTSSIAIPTIGPHWPKRSSLPQLSSSRRFLPISGHPSPLARTSPFRSAGNGGVRGLGGVKAGRTCRGCCCCGCCICPRCHPTTSSLRFFTFTTPTPHISHPRAVRPQTTTRSPSPSCRFSSGIFSTSITWISLVSNKRLLSTRRTPIAQAEKILLPIILPLTLSA